MIPGISTCYLIPPIWAAILTPGNPRDCVTCSLMLFSLSSSLTYSNKYPKTYLKLSGTALTLYKTSFNLAIRIESILISMADEAFNPSAALPRILPIASDLIKTDA